MTLPASSRPWRRSPRRSRKREPLTETPLQPQFAERLSRLSSLAQAARMRVNYLTDRMNGRLAGLAGLRGVAAPITYQPGPR